MELTDEQKKRIEAEEAYRAQVATKDKPAGKLSKTVAGLLAIFLGSIGIHKFYLGKIGQGILYILFAWTFIPSIVALIEGIIYLTMSDEEFNRKYGNASGSGAKRAIFAIAIYFSIVFLLGILSTIALIALNPAGQIAKAMDTKRQSDIKEIMYAIVMYRVDNNNALPPGIDTTEKEISSDGADLCRVLLTKYVSTLPIDPDLPEFNDIKYISAPCPASYRTHYYIKTDAAGDTVTISATSSEQGKWISVTR